MKKIKLLLAITAIMLCMTSLAACSLLDDGTKEIKLIMNDLTWNSEDRTVTFDAIEPLKTEHTEYEVVYKASVNGKEWFSVFAYDGKAKISVYWHLDQSGTQSISVYAVGLEGFDSEGKKIKYLDSDPKTIEFTCDAPKKEVYIQVGELTFSDETKILSWDKVTGASGYKVSFGSPSTKAGAITENGDKMECVMPSTSTSFYVRVDCIGSETETHIYKDGASASATFNMTPYSTMRPSAPILSVEDKKICFAPVKNPINNEFLLDASHYELKINGVKKVPVFNGIYNRFEYSVNSSLRQYVSVKTVNMPYSVNYRLGSSSEANQTLLYGYEADETKDVDLHYSIIEEKFITLFKSNYPGTKTRYVQVLGVNLETNLAYVKIEIDKAETIYDTNMEIMLFTLNLGTLPTKVDEIPDFLIARVFAKEDISTSLGMVQKMHGATTSHSQSNAEGLVSTLRTAGEIPNSAHYWAIATVFEANEKFLDVVVALKNNQLVSLRLTIDTSKNNTAEAIDYYIQNPSSGTISNKITTAYTDLSTLAA